MSVKVGATGFKKKTEKKIKFERNPKQKLSHFLLLTAI